VYIKIGEKKSSPVLVWISYIQISQWFQAERQHFSVPSSAQTESDQFLDGGGNRAICTGRNEAET
jgi:hypothetical protein